MNQLGNEHHYYEISVVYENIPAVVLDISSKIISRIYPETFEGKIVEDENINATMTSLPPTLPPEDDASILPKIEQNITPHI